jgi:GNAT superfamily N-acetyltransferase
VISFRNTLKPGDIGHLTWLHGTLYMQEYGYDKTFEAYVAEGLAKFVKEYDPSLDRIWFVEDDGKMIASVAIASQPGNEAQLRWYLVIPEYRGQGLGKKLIGDAIKFCRETGFSRIFLWTASELSAAHHLYISFGFEKTEEKYHFIWNKNVCEEKWELSLYL